MKQDSYMDIIQELTERALWERSKNQRISFSDKG